MDGGTVGTGGTGGTTQVPLVSMLIRSEIASGQCFVSYFLPSSIPLISRSSSRLDEYHRLLSSCAQMN